MRFEGCRPGRGMFGHHGHHGGREGREGRGEGRHGGWFGAMASRFGDEGGFGGPFGGFGGGGFGGGFGGGGRFGGGRGGGRGRMFAAGELRLLLLSLVSQQERRHGYDLIKAIEELTGGHYAPSPGVVYPTLALLVDEGLIAEVAGEGTRKAFSITPAGQDELAQRAEDLAPIIARLTGLAQASAREASPPVRRAFANLGTALRQRVTGGDFDAETALKVADILDEAARKIERL